jgi:four helix bundle protein
MSRDYRQLRVFRLADDLVVDVYRYTATFPVEERYGLQSQIRRAMISVASNLVEGSQRSSTRDYLHFVSVSLGSASEARYLLDLSTRLGFLNSADHRRLDSRLTEVIRGLARLISRLRNPVA